MLSHNLFSAVIPLNKNNYCQARSKPRQPRDVHFLPVLFLPVRWFEATQKGTMISSKAWPSHPKSYKYLSLVILTARTRRCRKYMLVYKSMLYIYIYVYIYIHMCKYVFYVWGAVGNWNDFHLYISIMVLVPKNCLVEIWNIEEDSCYTTFTMISMKDVGSGSWYTQHTTPMGR